MLCYAHITKSYITSHQQYMQLAHINNTSNKIIHAKTPSVHLATVTHTAISHCLDHCVPLLLTVHEVRSFLGLAGYYRRFVKDFSKVASRLTDLLHKNYT